MIFPVLEVESTVQIDDKTRLNGSKTFVSKDNVAITLVEIEPEAGAGFIDVTGSSYKDWYLDWAYSGVSRDVTVTLRVTAGSTVSFSKVVSVLTDADDMLYSNDQDIIAIESDILKWVPEGRSSYLNVHREAQIKIIDWLAEANITDVYGNRLSKDRIIDIEEVKSWSKYLTLSLIFRNISNSIDDIFSEKAKYYTSVAKDKADRTKVRLDLDGDGQTSRAEDVNLQSRDLIRE